MQKKKIRVLDRVREMYPKADPESMLLALYREFGTCKDVGDHLGFSESGIYRVIHDIELRRLANGNGNGGH